MNASYHSRRFTPYEGPVAVCLVTVGARKIRLVRPAEPDRLLEEPLVHDWNARDDYMPYWAYLWPGAYLLAEALAKGPSLAGERALEIGCGLGLAGLVCVSVGMHVVFTDYDEAPLGFVSRSAAENGFDPASFAVRVLDWRDLPNERFPVILGADLLYERRLVPLVVNLIDRLLEPTGVALLADPLRAAAEDLEPCLASAGLAWEVQPVAATTETGESVRGKLYRIGRRL